MRSTSPDGARGTEIAFATDAEFLSTLQQCAAGHGPAINMALHLVDVRVEHDAALPDTAEEIRRAYKAAIGPRLARSIRRGDACFELAPDSFAVIQPGPIARNGSVVLAARLLILFSEPLNVSGCELTIDVTIGSSVYPRDAPNADQLLANARIALLEAHRGTYGRCVHFGKALAPWRHAMFDDVELIHL